MHRPASADLAIIEELLNPEFNFSTTIITPFKKELNKNILKARKASNKHDIISHYIFEFWDLQNFFKEFEEILFEGIISHSTPEVKAFTHINKSGIVKELNKVETYAVQCHELFKLIFREIQLCCIKFKIDLSAICEELKACADNVDYSIFPALKKPTTKDKPTSGTKAEKNFDNLLIKNKAAFIMNMLEEMSITVNGKSQLGPRKKGALRGIVEALKEKNILPQLSINCLCALVADKIGLELKSKLDFSETSNAFRKKAIRYIAEHCKA